MCFTYVLRSLVELSDAKVDAQHISATVNRVLSSVNLQHKVNMFIYRRK